MTSASMASAAARLSVFGGGKIGEALRQIGGPVAHGQTGHLADDGFGEISDALAAKAGAQRGGSGGHYSRLAANLGGVNSKDDRRLQVVQQPSRRYDLRSGRAGEKCLMFAPCLIACGGREYDFVLAVRVRFELTEPVKVQRFSRPPHSTTLPPHRVSRCLILANGRIMMLGGSMTHRQWPVPDRPWILRMGWRDLLFAHWTVDAAVLRRLIPERLELDLFDGRGYVGAVPFRMEGVTLRMAPPIPGLHAFPELNLRTYVKAGGKPGVWFFSLDAGQRFAVRVARRFSHLAYFDARFDIRNSGESIEYSAVRTHRGSPSAAFKASYRAAGAVFQSAPGSLDAWLTDRYCLYSADGAGHIYRGEIDHQPWPLQRAAAEVQVNTLGDWLGIGMKGPPEALHFAKSLDVHAWLVDRV